MNPLSPSALIATLMCAFAVTEGASTGLTKNECPPLEFNTDYPGNDLNAGGQYGRVPGHLTLAQCRAACLNLDQCVGYTFVKSADEGDNCAVKREWDSSRRASSPCCDSQKIDRSCETHGCRPRTHVGACPWLPNGGSQKRETCLTATDNRPRFAGQECVWCEKDCQGKHQCEVKSYAQPIANYTDCSPTDCRPRTHVGACPWLPNGGSQKRETCLTATDNRPQFAGQECVWCEKDCEGKHQCEVKSRAQPIANYADCSPTDCRPRTHVGACPWLPNGGSQNKETCLTATDNRPQFAGQECVWCEKDCQGKHQCEVKSYAQPIANYAHCSNYS